MERETERDTHTEREREGTREMREMRDKKRYRQRVIEVERDLGKESKIERNRERGQKKE